VLSNACRPQIVVDYPPRGSTLKGEPGKPVVTVTGSAKSAAGPIKSLTLNDAAVAVAEDGTFALDVVDVDTDPALVALYTDEVPVITIEGRKAFKYRVDAAALRAKLDRAVEGTP